MAVHHQIAYYTGIESMLSLKINNKVSLIRTMLAEIERIENHVIWFGNLMNLLSSDLDYVELVRLWKEFSKIIKILNNGKPHLADTLSLGSSIEVSNETASRALRIAKQVIPMIFDMLYKYSYSSFVEEKCKGVGIITQAQGYKEGFTGPVLRSTGNGIDVRHTTPYLSYTSGEISQLWDVVSFTDSDIFARVQVRLWEIKNSYSVIEYILKSLENYVRGVEAAKINEDKKYLPKNEMSISKVESPHGELQYYFKTNPEKELKVMDAVRIITPDMLNFYAMKNAGLIGNKLSHVPNIIHSMDFFFENIDL
jgi:Ni,Fe-hydrogenase III large subunit